LRPWQRAVVPEAPKKAGNLNLNANENYALAA